MFLGKIGEWYSFKKSDSQCKKTISTETSVNEIMETKKAGENDPSTQDPTANVTYEDGYIELFNQFSSWMSSLSD